MLLLKFKLAGAQYGARKKKNINIQKKHALGGRATAGIITNIKIKV